MDKRDKLLEEKKRLSTELAEAEAALPAHTIRPHQMQRVIEAEEKLAEIERRLRELGEE